MFETVSQLTPSLVNTPERIPSTTQSSKQDSGLDHLCSQVCVFAEIEGQLETPCAHGMICKHDYLFHQIIEGENKTNLQIQS